MTPERWERIKDVLHRAMQLVPVQRDSFLDDACTSDESLRREVESLLAADDEARSSFLQSPALHVTLQPGMRLGEYEVQNLLGSGGMGEVYRARDQRLGRDVAIKVLPSFLSSDPDRLRRFEQEARAAAALNHPNILAVFQMGTYQGTPYLVSELLEGETLRERSKRGPLTQRKAIDYAVQTARGLAAAHEKGIVHRDMKPENLFVTKDGRMKILDFGLAKLTQPPAASVHSAVTLDDRTEPGTVMGTVGYMSPEQVRAQVVDHRSDIFAFGAILYEMLAGRRAFQKPTAADTMSAILNEDPPAISKITPNISPALLRIMHRCLEKNPEQRFQSAADLTFALEALSDSGSASTGASMSGNGLTRRLWWVAAAVAVVAVTLFWRWYLPVVPEVEGVLQITDDGNPKLTSTLVSDGSRVYFNEMQGGSWVIAQVAAIGGQTAAIPSRIQRPTLTALAADFSSLLVLGSDNPAHTPLWMLPLPAGEPRKLSEVVGQDATFFPDGNIVFARASSLYVAEKDGSNPRKLFEFPSHVFNPVVSPDGKRVRVSIWRNFNTRLLWEVNSDGSGAHALLKGWQSAADACCGRWTSDRRYFVFQNRREGHTDIWALPEGGRWFGRSSSPLRLTNGPLSYELPFPSPDGKQVFVMGLRQRGELTRYDGDSHQFVPYLSGISAMDATVSRDGKWVTYMSYPDHTLWRSHWDGSERLQLTYPPMVVFYPRISPDGTRVAYGSMDANGNAAAYVLPLEGGTPTKIADNAKNPSWSPDSNSVLVVVTDNIGWESGFLGLRTIDLQTGRINSVPDSAGKGGAFWPLRDMLVAPTFDGGVLKFVTFDLKMQKWADLVRGPFDNWMQSVDGKYLYYTAGDEDPKVLRVRLSDHKVETVARLKNFRPVVDEDTGSWVGVAPDGSVLLTRDIGTQEIYALNVKWP
jgi:serine/threonine protein kinase